MTRPIKQMNDSAAWQLLRDLPYLTLGGCTSDGTPIARPLNHAVHDGSVWFHSAPKGQKMGLIDQRVVASGTRWIGTLPSWAQHPERACPASTWFMSVEVAGVLQIERDEQVKVDALNALMRRLQPQGGYRQIRLDDPMYSKAVASLRVLRLRPTSLSAKVSMGQHKPLPTRNRIAHNLWTRAHPLTTTFMASMIEVSSLRPEFLTAPHGCALTVVLDEASLSGAVDLVRPAWWNHGGTVGSIAAAHRASAAWVGCTAPDGQLIGTVRAVSDGERTAWISDMMVRADWRGRGIGAAMIKLLLDHPAMRRVRKVRLETEGAEGFYQKLGFERCAAGRSFLQRAVRSYRAGQAG